MDIQNKKTKPLVAAKTQHAGTLTGIWLVFALCAFVIHFLMKAHILVLPGQYHHLILQLSLAVGTGALVLAAAAFAVRIIGKKAHQRAEGYNLIRAIRLSSLLVVAGIFISFLFHNWYTAVASLGLISLILGFALQTPISSFIGWLYIIARSPYRVTDRIQINGYKGDVVEIGYLDTTLWEFGGDYLTNDLPSGRLIRFPNSLVFQSAVFNYSWHKFPYIWNELPFHIAYESDLLFVEHTIREITSKELASAIIDDIESLKQDFEETPVGEIPIKEFPYVSFRTNANTWIEVIVTYLVEPKKAAETKSRILKNVVAALMQQPDKAMFPKTNSR